MSSISLPSISSSHTSVRSSVRRLLSANQIEYNNLLSRRKELRTQLSHFKEENALLQAQHTRMLNAITSFECGDNDLPHTVKKNTDDLHALNEEIRSQNRKIMKTEQRLLKKELQLQKAKDELKRSKVLIDERKLADWDELMEQWSEASQVLSSKDQRIKELQEQARSLTAAHNLALNKDQSQSKELELKSRQLHESIQQLQIKIKAVDRDIANGVIHDQSRLARSTSDTAVYSPAPLLDPVARGHGSATGTQQTPSLSLQQKIHIYDQKRKELWHQQLQKREEKMREVQEKANLQQEKVVARLKKMQEDKERQNKLEEDKNKERKLKEENDRKRKEKERALKEEKREKRRLLRLKLEQQKRRKEREEELQRENEENEKIIAAIEQKVAVLEEQRKKRLETEEQERREREELALQEREKPTIRKQEEIDVLGEEESYEPYQDYTKGQKLLSIREQSEVVEIPVLDVGEGYSNEAGKEEAEDIIYGGEISPNELATIDNSGYQRDPSVAETLVLEDFNDIEERTSFVPPPAAHETEISVQDDTPVESHLVGLPSSIRRRYEKQRRDYIFPPVVNKLHQGIPTYYSHYN